MANSGDVSFFVTADTSAADAALAKFQSNIKSTVDGIKGHFDNLAGILEKAQGALVAFAAVAAGAGAFDKAIAATTKFTGEVNTLSKVLGISTEEASGLNIALGDIGSDADTYSAALQKLTRQVRTNEDGVTALGIATRDANGQYLNGRASMDSALKGLADYKEGTDRNLAAQVAFGRGVGDVTTLMKLSTQIQDDATKKAVALGLVIGGDNVAAVKAFKLATNDVNDVLLAVENVIGEALLPVLTKLALWFSDGGPAVVSIFKVAMDGVGAVLGTAVDIFIELWATAKDVIGGLTDIFGTDAIGVKSWGELFKNAFTVIEVAMLTVKLAFMQVSDFIRGAIEVLVAELLGLAGVAQAALTLDWGKIKSAWNAGMQGVADAVEQADKRMVDHATATANTIRNLLAPEAREYRASDNYGGAATKGTKTYKDSSAGAKTPDTSKARFAVDKAQLEADANIQKEYLKETQEAYDDAYAHNLISTQQYYDEKLTIARAELQAEIDAKTAEIAANEAAQKTAQTDIARLGLKAEEIKLLGQLTVLQAQYANASVTNARAEADAERKRADALREVAIASTVNSGNAQVAMDRIALDQRKALRETSDAQAIQEEKGFEDRLTAIQAQAIQDRIQLEKNGTNDPVKLATLNAQLEQLERDHQAKLSQLDEAATIERSKYQIQAAQAVQTSFETFFTDLTDRTKKLSDTFKDFGKSLLAAFNQTEAKKLAEQLVGPGTSGGGIMMGILGKLFPSSAGGGTAGAPSPVDASATKASSALDAFSFDCWGTGDAMKSLGTDGIGGMVKSATDWVAKQLIGTSAQQAQNAVTTTVTSAMSSLTTAAYSAAAALNSVRPGGGSVPSGGPSGGPGAGPAGDSASTGGAVAGGNTNDSAIAGFFDDVPSFDVGTDFVPRDMLALVHEGERITPARYNNASDRASNVALTQHINVPQSTSRASAAQAAGLIAISTAAAMRRNA